MLPRSPEKTLKLSWRPWRGQDAVVAPSPCPGLCGVEHVGRVCEQCCRQTPLCLSGEGCCPTSSERTAGARSPEHCALTVVCRVAGCAQHRTQGLGNYQQSWRQGLSCTVPGGRARQCPWVVGGMHTEWRVCTCAPWNVTQP